MKKILHVKGMHCNSCKLLLEKSIGTLDHVKHVNANVQQGTVTIDYEKVPNFDEIDNTIKDCGYEVSAEKVHRPWLSTNIKDYKIILFSLIGFLMLYFILKQTGILSFNLNNSSPSLGLVVIIGLTAGFSSCMAVVGGLVLAISAKQNTDKDHLSFGQKVIPHVRFNSGRIVGFGILGGILGLFGSVISLSPFVMSVMTLIIGGVMLLLGINLSNISPKLSAISLSLPTGKLFGKKETNLIKEKKTGINKYIGIIGSGALTFFLPCGFTFAMQMYAIGTGSFWMGMAVMALFAVGTLPGLMSVGSLTSIFKGKTAKVAYQAIGVLVVLFGVFNISNAYGVLQAKFHTTTLSVDQQKLLQNQDQTVINMVYGENGLQPKVLNLDLGKRYKIVVDVQVAIYSCLNTMYIPGLDENYKELKKGEKVEYTVNAVTPGEYPFVCATMGMSQGSKIIIK